MIVLPVQLRRLLFLLALVNHCLLLLQGEFRCPQMLYKKNFWYLRILLSWSVLSKYVMQETWTTEKTTLQWAHFTYKLKLFSPLTSLYPLRFNSYTVHNTQLTSSYSCLCFTLAHSPLPSSHSSLFSLCHHQLCNKYWRHSLPGSGLMPYVGGKSPCGWKLSIHAHRVSDLQVLQMVTAKHEQLSQSCRWKKTRYRAVI